MPLFTVLSTQRSGSTLLVDYLSSHPTILAHGELFQKLNPKLVGTKTAPRHYEISYQRFRHGSVARRAAHRFFRRRLINDYLDRTLTADGEIRAVGMKLMYNQAKQYPEVVEWLEKHDAKFVHLIRANGLRILVSRQLAEKRGTYSMLKRLDALKVRLDTATLTGELEKMERTVDAYRRFCAGMNSMEVIYERLTADTSREMASVLRFLEQDPNQKLSTRLVKTNPYTLRESIENYDEVANSLRHTPFERFLESN